MSQLLKLFHNQGKGSPVGGKLSYASKVLSTAPANLIAYWPLWELSGTTADNWQGAARDGTYVASPSLGQTGIGDGKTSVLLNGTTQYINIYTASLASAFNAAEGTMMAWAKVSAVGVWTDANEGEIIYISPDGLNNIIALQKIATNNTIAFKYRAGGTEKTVTKGSMTTTGWMNMAMTWSATADQVKAYYGGVQEGSTLTGLGTWAGTPANTRTLIGARLTTPLALFSGYVAHIAVWTTPLSAAQILSLATV